MCLQPIRGVEGSDYINASHIDVSNGLQLTHICRATRLSLAKQNVTNAKPRDYPQQSKTLQTPSHVIFCSEVFAAFAHLEMYPTTLCFNTRYSHTCFIDFHVDFYQCLGWKFPFFFFPPKFPVIEGKNAVCQQHIGLNCFYMIFCRLDIEN